LKSRLFGSSGVRGLVNVDLTPTLAAKLGLAVVKLSKAKETLVARDTRVSGSMLENSLVSGFLAAGANVTCLGVAPTPMLAYLVKKCSTNVGVMITASHNPSQYNGLKFFDSYGVAYNENSQNEIEKIIENEEFELADWRKIGEAVLVDKSQSYIEKIKEAIQLRTKLHVIVDPGCGATYSLAPVILKNVGCKVTAINAQPDGFFPARSSEPNVESLKPLARIVKEMGVDAGLAYDGDGDRVAFIDENGCFVDFDRVLAAYSAYVVKENRGGAVVTNVEASMCVEKMVEAQGGKVIRTKVGDVYISEAIKRNNAVFGGEPCGAWVHPQFHYCPDGIYSSAILLKAMEDEDKSLSEFISETPQYPTIRENIACGNEVKCRVMENVAEYLENAFPEFKELSNVDGVRLVLKKGWILVRASGTEPLLRLTVEGESLNAAREIIGKGLSIVRKLVEEMRE
jgi:phosphoglucosamine mutase